MQKIPDLFQRIAMQRQQDIIQALLDWKNPYTGEDLAAHLTAEITKLRHKVERSPEFAGEYSARSGELPATVIAKLDDCLELLDNWREAPAEKRVLSPRDCIIASDLLEFVMVPFYRFGASAADSLANLGGVATLPGGSGGSVSHLYRHVGKLASEHRRLVQILVELCDTAGYSVSPHIRSACKDQPANQLGSL